MREYKEFLENKKIKNEASGISIKKENINKILFDFQRDIVLWSLKKGKACVFAGTGLGKTLSELIDIKPDTTKNITLLEIDSKL